MRCLILAGGFATRLRGLAKEVAKPLLLLGQKPVITHIVEKIPCEMGVIVSINKRFERDFSKWRNGLDRDVEFFVEDALSNKEKLGALKSVHYMIKVKKLSEDLLIIAGDNFFEFNICDFIASYDGKAPLVAVYDIEDKDRAKRFGVVRLNGRRITEFYEKPLQPVTSLIAIGCYIVPARTLEHLSDCCINHKDNLGDFIAYLIQKEDVYAYTFKGTWFDIGTTDSYEEAKRTVSARDIH